jgi:hypothetical protein
MSGVYRMTQNSVIRKYSVVLRGLIRLEPASQFVEQYYSVVSYILNMGDLVDSKEF